MNFQTFLKNGVISTKREWEIMHVFTIRDIENLTGIKAHTIRIWEQRYNLCCCKRKESNHRQFDNDDLKQILRIATLYRLGYKISQIARLNEEEILQIASKPESTHHNESVINQLIECAIEFDEQRFDLVLHKVILHMGLEKALLSVVYPTLERIGSLWLTNHIVPAQEHFISYLIQKKLIVAIDGVDYPVKVGKRRVLLFTPPEEHHEIPLLLMHYQMKKHGVNAVYIGKNVSNEVLEAYVIRHQPTHLYTHIITHFAENSLENYLEKISLQFPNVEIVVSGPATQWIQDPPAAVTIYQDPEDVKAFGKMI